MWQTVYAGINGIEDHRYLSGYVFARMVRPALNNEMLAESYTDKNLYDRLFPETQTPKSVLRSIHGRYYSDDYEPVGNLQKALAPYEGNELVVKPATESGGGNGVLIGSYEGGEIVTPGSSISLDDLSQKYGRNFNVQTKILQHEVLGAFHPASVNSIRAMTLRHPEGITVLSAAIRFGHQGERVDNQAAGGISCGINAKGILNSFAIDSSGRVFKAHPHTGHIFEGVQIPGLAAVRSLVEELHARLLHFDLVSWDIAIDENGTPVLIEFNILGQGLQVHQLNNGPVFGDFTDYVLKRANI